MTDGLFLTAVLSYRESECVGSTSNSNSCCKLHSVRLCFLFSRPYEAMPCDLYLGGGGGGGTAVRPMVSGKGAGKSRYVSPLWRLLLY